MNRYTTFIIDIIGRYVDDAVLAAAFAFLAAALAILFYFVVYVDGDVDVISSLQLQLPKLNRSINVIFRHVQINYTHTIPLHFSHFFVRRAQT